MRRSDSETSSSSLLKENLLSDNVDASSPTSLRLRNGVRSLSKCHDCSVPDSQSDDLPALYNNAEFVSARRRLLLASLLVIVFMSVEVVAGLYANSLAILSDAAHMLSDFAGFMVNLVALLLTSKLPTRRLTFGWHRAEILGVLLSILMIWALTGALLFEAVNRIRMPSDANGAIIFGTATVGLIFNLIIMKILQGTGHGHSHGGSSQGGSHGHSHMNMNVRAAWIHAIGDLLQSLGVMAAGLIIWIKPSWSIADPICTFLFGFLVLMTTFRMLIDAVNVLMAAAPEGIACEDVQADILRLHGVQTVHDLHIWCISVGKPLLSVHVIIDYSDPDRTLDEIRLMLKMKYKISHATIQMERNVGQSVVVKSSPMRMIRKTSYSEENCEEMVDCV